MNKTMLQFVKAAGDTYVVYISADSIHRLPKLLQKWMNSRKLDFNFEDALRLYGAAMAYFATPQVGLLTGEDGNP